MANFKDFCWIAVLGQFCGGEDIITYKILRL